ncbi:hypothetical protein [Mucilaginibacter panaciglaebae]|uniref:Uncharacterized protein n=1 Tax=Mucilaginibacter panaciglaebae TaxID=502331 RepID=A0ABP7WGS0_9SPHI
MSRQIRFIPQRQFHVLVNDADEEQNITVLPSDEGNFRVIKQGEILGEITYTAQKKIVCYKGRFKKAVMDQLEKHIHHYCSYAF